MIIAVVSLISGILREGALFLLMVIEYHLLCQDRGVQAAEQL